MFINMDSKLMKTRLRFTLYAIFFALALAALWAGRAFAQGGQPPTDDQVNAVAKELFCPVCENTPLDVCPTQACAQWREQIRSMLAEGKTSDEIKQYFVDTYGDRVLNEPPRTGFNWLAYIVPPLVILLGAFGVVQLLKGMKKPVAASPAGGAARSETQKTESLVDEYAARFEEEVRKRK